MLRLGTSSVWIEIDGKPAPTYDVQVAQDAKVVSGWIASQTGKVRNVFYHTRCQSIHGP
jgi:sulfur transfer protein SufE